MAQKQISEETVRIAAHVVGPDSAAAKALADAEKRRSAGETIIFIQTDESIIVAAYDPKKD